jgi:hypothetical protein
MWMFWARILGVCGAAILASSFVISSQTLRPDPAAEFPWPTETRVRQPGWWPTKGAPPMGDYVGEALCAKCHSQEAAGWEKTPMAHASMLPQDSPILQQFPSLSRQSGPYTFSYVKDGQKWHFLVTNGANSITEPLTWAFGFNHKGQAYLFERNGAIYDARMSFYSGVQGLDVATGHPEDAPPNLESALGRRMSTFETTHCFGCHSTASTTSNHFDPSHATPGVSCEACHGPGAKHVTAMKSGKIDEGRRAIFNPRTLGAFASVDFCGACHRTWGDVLDAGTTGVRKVRFQPYRLERSRCWGKGDVRLKCTSCHNPHEPIVREASFYDPKCLACHVTSGMQISRDHSGKACPVGAKDCVTCHMPSAVISSMHAPFTDHRIRVAKPGETFPE